MAWYNKFPWTNFHELNLDWILDIVGKAEKALPTIDQAAQAANNAVKTANMAAATATDSAREADRAAQDAQDAADSISPVTATAATGVSAGVRVQETRPGIRFDFTLPQGKQGEPGKAAAGSLCDNGYFLNPVNQRGNQSYDGTGSKMYTIDRWYTTDSGSGVITLAANRGVTVKAGCHIMQEIPREVMQEYSSEVGVSYTAVARDFNGNLHIDDDFVNVSVADGSGITTVTLGAGTWEYVALYKGEYNASNIPGYVPKGYQVEFINCQRYFVGAAGRFSPVTINALGNARMSLALPVPMRINPTATLINGDSIILNIAGTNKALTVTGVSVESSDLNFVYINLACTSDSSTLYAAGSTFLTCFNLSADM